MATNATCIGIRGVIFKLTLTAYLAGAFGTAGDKEADDFCIRQLLPNKLKDQYCFKTEAAIECLKFMKGEKIWLK